MGKKILMCGNDACGEGAMLAGCTFYAGYPITPQNELIAYMAKRMVDTGGTFIQAESELAAISMVFGAAAVRALVEGHDGVMVAVNPPRLDYVPLRVATAKLKLVTADDYGVMTARTLDVSYGD